MSRRQLPHRAARTIIPAHFRQSPSPPRSTKSEPESQEEVARKQLEAKRRMNQIHNLKKYPYTRSLHYFMNLDQLPRSEESVSYALHQQICIRQTFSKDTHLINQSLIGSLVNRHLIGLPINTSGRLPSLSENNCKNVCYGYLFQIQDKKHNNDLIIYTLKLILKKWPKVNPKQLTKLDFMKKDAQFQELLSQKIEQDSVKQILKKRLDYFQSKKYINSMNCQFEDSVFFYHSLDQRLHNSVNTLRYKLTEEYLLHLIFDKQCKQYEFFQGKQSIEKFLLQMTRYYEKTTATLSKNTIQNIVTKWKINLINKGLDNKFLTNYPIAILRLGRDKIVHALTDFLIGRRAFCLGQAHFYKVKLMIKKLFGRDLKVKSEKIITYDLFYKNFKKIIYDISKWQKAHLKKSKSFLSDSKYPLLDDRLNQDSNLGKRLNIFRLGRLMEISKKEYIFLMTYYWLSQCVNELYPCLLQFQDLIDIIGSDFYSKVNSILVYTIGSPLTGLIYYIFEDLPQLFNKTDRFQQKGLRLYFEFDQEINVGMIWREDFKIEKPTLNLDQDQDFLAVSKKVKTK